MTVDHSVLGCTARKILGPLNSIFKEATVQVDGNLPLTTIKGADKSASLARGCLRCAQRLGCIQMLGGVHVSTACVGDTYCSHYNIIIADV